MYSGEEAARAEHEWAAKAAPCTARERWRAARTFGRPGGGCERRLASVTMHVQAIAIQGRGPNVQVNRRAQRVRLNLVLDHAL